jgi:hypothetical protein
MAETEGEVAEAAGCDVTAAAQGDEMGSGRMRAETSVDSVATDDDSHGLQSPTQLALIREAISLSASLGVVPNVPNNAGSLQANVAHPPQLSTAADALSSTTGPGGARAHGARRTDAAQRMVGGVQALAHAPMWMMNPALGGFNPLPPRQALRMSVCSKYVRKRNQPEHFTEALISQAENMIANDKNFFRRGSVSGWKIKPATAVKAMSATRRVGGVRPRSSLVPDGAGFFFDETADKQAGLSSPPSRAHSRIQTRPLVSQVRPTSLPADGMLPPADLASHPSVYPELSTEDTRRFPSTHFNVLTRPARQPRKAALDGLVPRGLKPLAARPPAWLAPLAHRASVSKAEQRLSQLRGQSPDLFLRHMQEQMQQQPDAMRVLPERSTRTARLA